jgi:serine/threonine protein kinase
VLGTAAYIAPEQVAGHSATPATDVYSFGVILFRMLTGRLPFEAADAYSLAAMHRDRPPPSVFEFRRDAPARLESLVFAALAKSPADRPPDGKALLRELGVGSRP